jgi:uncharacterized phage-associated protein
MTADVNKLKSVIGYIASKKPGLGKLKLFKLLYLVDFTAYPELGHSITGEQYENFAMGPVPRTLWDNFNLLTGSCVTLTQVEMGFGLPEQQMRVRPGFQIQLTPEETSLIDGVLAKYGDMHGNALKELTHPHLTYRATARGDIIPYGMAGYIDYKQPTEEEKAELLKDGALMHRLHQAVERKQIAHHRVVRN